MVGSALISAWRASSYCVSIQAGIPTRRFHKASTLPFLAKQAGIGHRRAERAMRELQLPDLVQRWQWCTTNAQGDFHGLAALR